MNLLRWPIPFITTLYSPITKLSFTHIVELLRVDTEKRDFYAAQCISGGWSVIAAERERLEGLK